VTVEHGRNRYRHESAVKSRKDAGRHLHVVGHHHHDAIVAAQPKTPQTICQACHILRELAVGARPRADQRELVFRSAPDMAVDQEVGGVESVHRYTRLVSKLAR
jgi:hypothetical protein